MTTKTRPPKAKSKTGAPQGNRNALINGSRIQRLALGQLPKDMSRVTRYCRSYRLALEAAVASVHGGEVDLVKAHLIDAAATHEQHAQVCRWLLRQRIGKMSTSDIRECSKQIAGAKDARNRAVAALQLDRDRTADILATLYTTHIDEDDDGRQTDSE